MRLDDKDKIILEELQKNADRSNKEISNIVNLSPSAYAARKNSLKEKGAIKHIKATIDYKSFGLSTIGFVFVALNNNDLNADKAFAEYARKNSHVLELHTLLGRSDLIMKIIARDNEHLTDIVESISSKAPGSNTETYVVGRTHFEVKENNIPDLD